MSDHLAKALHPHVMKAAEVCGDPSWPREAGWYDFLSHDRPETEDCVVMAKAAFYYLAIDSGGHWQNMQPSLHCVLQFLRFRLKQGPTREQLLVLKPLLQSSSPDMQAIDRWFDDVFPLNP